MESKQAILEFLQFITVVCGVVVLLWKGIVEYFKSVRESQISNIEELVDRRIHHRLKSIEQRVDEMNREFHKSLIEIFKEFK